MASPSNAQQHTATTQLWTLSMGCGGSLPLGNLAPICWSVYTHTDYRSIIGINKWMPSIHCNPSLRIQKLADLTWINQSVQKGINGPLGSWCWWVRLFGAKPREDLLMYLVILIPAQKATNWVVSVLGLANVCIVIICIYIYVYMCNQSDYVISLFLEQKQRILSVCPTNLDTNRAMEDLIVAKRVQNQFQTNQWWHICQQVFHNLVSWTTTEHMRNSW